MTAPAAATTARRRTNADARRLRKDAFLEGATRALVRAGLHQTTMDDIALAAGTSKVMLYRYFASKEDLIHCALERVEQRFVTNERQPYAGIGTGVREALGLAREDPDGFLLLFKLSTTDPEYERYLADYRATIVDENIKRMSADPKMAHFDEPMLRMCAETIATLVIDAITRWIGTGDPARDAEFVDWTLATLKGLYKGWTKRSVAGA